MKRFLVPLRREHQHLGPTSAKRMGAGWHDWSTTGTPDSCQRIGTTTPTRPTVTTQAHAPVTLLNATNGHVHYTYVDSENRAIHAESADLSGSTPIGLAAVPGFTNVTGPTSTGEHQNGRVQLVATGHDAEVRTNTQTTASGPWATTGTLGGFIPAAATTVRLADGTLHVYALDASGVLWARKQAGPSGPLTAWTPLATTPLVTTSPLTIVPADTGVRIVGRGTNGHFHTATHSGWTTSNWTDLGGPTFTGTASAVVMPDNTVQLFATDTTGTVQTQRQTSVGFPATWTAIPGITATGSPSAIMAPDGTLQIVTRATDDYVYYTGQPAPGAGAFNPWREITAYTEQTSTDPTELAVPAHNTWIIAYRNDIDAPKLRRYQPPTTARSTATFTDIPLVLTEP